MVGSHSNAHVTSPAPAVSWLLRLYPLTVEMLFNVPEPGETNPASAKLASGEVMPSEIAVPGPLFCWTKLYPLGFRRSGEMLTVSLACPRRLKFEYSKSFRLMGLAVERFLTEMVS